jgi:hypothetical protein
MIAMEHAEKSNQIFQRVHELQRLSAPRPFSKQLERWSAQDTWAEDTLAELDVLAQMLDTLIKEAESGY